MNDVPSDCQQLVAMLRNALIKEHDAVNTYMSVRDKICGIMDEYGVQSKNAEILGSIEDITLEEMIHEQELNIMIQRIQLMCSPIESAFDIEEILKKAKQDTKGI